VRSAQYKELNYPELPKSNEGRGNSAPSSPANGTLGLDGESVRRPRQADLSKHISLEWKSLTDEEKAPYVRMSEEAKLVHARIYPGYKYQPRRKIEGPSGGKKSGLRPEASKKNGKSKKISKESKVTKRDELRCESEVDDKLSGQSDEQFQAINELSMPQSKLPSVCIEIGGDEQEDGTSAGDPSKEWTWLPEQTLLPINWGHDQDIGTASDEVMQSLDANINDGNEDELEFGNPFYFSFPHSVHESEGQTNVPPFFPFPAESESDAAFFADPLFDFQASTLRLQDDHLDAFPDVTQLPDHVAEGITNDYDLRRDSISSTVSGYELPDCSETYFSFSESLGFTLEELSAQYPEGTFSSESTMSSDLPNHVPSPVPALPSDQVPLTTTSGVPLRDPVASQSSCISPDGLLRPPVTSPVNHKGRSRPKKVPALRSFSLDGPSGCTDVRSIPTSNFDASNGITTSVLIPMTSQRYHQEMERDLEEYSRALECVASDSPMEGAQSFMSSFQISPPPKKSVANGKWKGKAVKAQNLDDGVLDLNADFDFEAAFGDIIDIHAPSERSETA